MSKWKEREDAIVRSIMSGNNACGTLKTATEKGKLETFLRSMIQPTLKVCADEEAQVERDARNAGATVNQMRFALESVVANIPDIPDNVKTALRAALPGHPHLEN